MGTVVCPPPPPVLSPSGVDQLKPPILSHRHPPQHGHGDHGDHGAHGDQDAPEKHLKLSPQSFA